MLESIRELYRETYAVELILSRSPSEHAPAIGAEVKLEKPEYRQHFVVTRRTPTPIAMHSINTFLSGVEPVVAQGAVAYQSVDSAVSDGLDVTVLVGVNGDNQHGTTLQLSGELRKVSWPENLSEATPVDTTPLKLRFPIVSVRSVQSRLDVKYEKPTVLSVLAGFEAGESIVITALVRKL
jgi:hypothetical protein